MNAIGYAEHLTIDGSISNFAQVCAIGLPMHEQISLNSTNGFPLISVTDSPN